MNVVYGLNVLNFSEFCFLIGGIYCCEVCQARFVYVVRKYIFSLINKSSIFFYPEVNGSFRIQKYFVGKYMGF